MSLASFNRMRRLQAQKKANEGTHKPFSKMNKAELVQWINENKNMNIADPKKYTHKRLVEIAK